MVIVNTKRQVRYLIILAIITLTCHCGGSADVVEGQEPVAEKSKFPTGDPRNCVELADQSQNKLKRFSTLPGIGWDNLRNRPAGQISEYSYTRCALTQDGRFLIPDSIFTIPIKASLVQTFGDIYESWNNVTSITSRSINVDAGIQKYGSIGISGSYSNEHTRMKKKQIQDDTVAARVQLRYLRYKARLQPESPLYSSFQTRVLSIAADLNQNSTQSAYYKAQLLVRDYGTHILTSVTAGAALVKTDFISRSYVASQRGDKRTIGASASASFGEIFKLGVSFKNVNDVQVEESYKKSMTHSYISTYGGPLFRPYSMSVNQWVDKLDDEMVPLDRSGDPLYFVITPELFPGLPVPLISTLQSYIQEAVEQYYEMNVRRGCTKRGSPNFSYSANIEDDTCMLSNTNFTFGGMYQTCSVSGRSNSYNACANLDTVNVLTKGYTCPTGYTSILLSTGAKLGKTDSSEECSYCGFLERCCNNVYFQATGHYKTYWCAATTAVPQNSGYLFGGMWSATTINLMTKTKRCPPYFYPVRILQEHFICLSDDYELGGPNSLPFGGFISCTAGNPLALGFGSDSNSALKNFIMKSTNYPKKCPQGFSQHLLGIDDGCEIRYCIKTGALSEAALMPIRRPPFTSRPEVIRMANVYTIVNNDNSIEPGRMMLTKAEYDNAMNAPKTGKSTSSYVMPFLASPLVTGFTILLSPIWTRFCA